MSSTSTTPLVTEPELTAHRQTRYEPPLGATEIVLLRHGASEPFYVGRPFPLTDGHGDPALAPEGEEQAVLAGRRLAGEKIDAVYVTNLRRTAQTAAPFLARTGLTATVEPDLREIFLGEWEGGLLRQHAVDGHPAWLKVLETGEWGHVPGAETSKQLQSRTVAALDRIHSHHPGQRVLCVVHGGVIGALVAHALGVEPRTMDSSENCSLHTIVISDDQWILRRFNDTTHLDHRQFAVD
jgi:2,3-bisphosphoglycerate-dependent phosphoglycerate mutase